MTAQTPIFGGDTQPLPGFSNPGHDSQRVFRSVLEAMSHPGRVVDFDDLPEPPLPLYPSSAAICLGLADFETPLWIDDAIAASAQTVNHLKFHCACPITTVPGAARIALHADSLSCADLARFCRGTDVRPEISTTVIVQVESFEEGRGKRLDGPGIDGARRLSVGGVPERFWSSLRENNAQFPRGVDVILCVRSAIVCLPRTTRVED
ncbi:phosphonate C-P lyase system protein PhnH [Varunaivibrio sulfuroxidans]|uniref:Alpha-D-ribose 1-methylphosphonate 5-triphosphate synthase subunit PhnH n=1 Tax=Varunaivibrio sulfuroxidans TaxID=1773489 RepID=A0A4R3JEQ8_9PROT|nr:phosphonate C-P lyase system protein PhnH [Varunaivibrio sulfuroxidans]TCS64287.1 alpha-D-ribose 1-methylphosphonate 5-triphosphate synthase subunit PhnH [Varunaivibrio sulfuroxidans]WES31275.1 phosphonate C-P lyase system protein PhnH [Varunaivibrio sulfuroxidans]